MTLAAPRRVRVIASAAKEREVLALLCDRAVFRTPYGGSMPVDETGVKDANYGPAGFSQEGDEFRYLGKEAIKLLNHSLDLLDDAVDALKDSDLVERTAWMVIRSAYYADPSDPSIVDVWRRRNPHTAEWHDCGVQLLAQRLRHEDLYVVWPKRMSSRKSAVVDKQNDDVAQLCRQLHHRDRKSRTKSVELASEITDYTPRRIWTIMGIRGWETEGSEA